MLGSYLIMNPVPCWAVNLYQGKRDRKVGLKAMYSFSLGAPVTRVQ